VRAWIDIDNPPQARYLLPFVGRFENAGHEVLLTAREYGDTLAILRNEGARFEPVGSSFGKGIPRKLYGLAWRSHALVKFVRRQRRLSDFVLTGSRSAAVAARRLGIPSFVIVDYEHVDLVVYRLSSSYIIHPSVIDAELLLSRGIARERLMPFEGLKEDISFVDVDFSSVAPSDLTGPEGSAIRVLFRPPAEESHYYRSESRDLALQLLGFLACRGARIVFSPRYDRQIRYLDDITEWHEDPIVLRMPLPVVPLLKAVDAVVSAGGTMLREAAYMNVPAYSILRSSIGAVDRYLSSIGRLSILASPGDFSCIELRPRGSIVPLRESSRAADDVTEMILDRAGALTHESFKTRAGR
jgi:predicted glycosyltransferase